MAWIWMSYEAAVCVQFEEWQLSEAFWSSMVILRYPLEMNMNLRG